MKNRYFKNNEEYFKFFKRMKDNIEIISVEIKNKIKVQYKKSR